MLSWAEALALANGVRPGTPPVSSAPSFGRRLPNPGNGCGCAAPANGSTPACGCPPQVQSTATASIVQGNASCVPEDSGIMTWTRKDCRPPVKITCPSHAFYKIDPDTRLVFFYDFTTCAFNTDPSPGGCPTSSAQPFAVQDEEGDYNAYVCLPDGIYRITNGGAGQPPVFTLVDSVPANCERFALKWEGNAFVVTGPLQLQDLDVAIPLCSLQ